MPALNPAMKALLPQRMWNVMLAAAVILVAASPREAGAAAEISVSGGPGAFGSVLVGSQSTVTFTLSNPGDATLTVSAMTLSGAAFSYVSPAPVLPLSIAAGGSSTFQVRFTPTSRAAFSGNIAITSNAPVGGSPNIALSGTGVSPEIVVEQPSGTGLTDGSATVSFGTIDLGSQPPVLTSDRTFVIRNSGDANMTGISVTGLTGSSFSMVSSPSATLAPGGSTTFTVRFAPTTGGSKSAAMAIASSDLDENPFDIALQGLAVAPILAVEVQSSAIANNATVSFGQVPVGFVEERVFTIRNAGTSTLTLNSVGITGTDNRVYNIVVSDPMYTTIAAGASKQFSVRFGPSATVSYNNASLVITNNSATSPFTANFSGSGGANNTLVDAFGYKAVGVAGGNIMPFIVEGEQGVIREGTLVGIDKAVPVDIGFDFYFYDKLYTRCSISTTGLVTFGGSSVDYTPDPIPSSSQPNNFIAPLWTDIEITGTSKVLYKLQGTAPNRVFIIKYEKVKLYHNGAATTDKRLTFQVQMYEGSNSIEVRYLEEDPSVAFPPQSLTVGLESRDYGTDQPQPGVGVVGLPFRHGLIDQRTNLPWTGSGSSILFTRPVVVTVESQYQKPAPTIGDPYATTTVNVGSAANGLNPSYGTIYRTAIGSSVRFEAPKYIYLNQHFVELPEAGDVNDPNPDKIAWYRLANDGYSIDGQPVQGAQSFAEITVTKDIKFVWRWEMEYAVHVKFPGVGTPIPDVGRTWYKLNSPLTASVDTLVDSEVGGVRLKTTGYRVTAYGPTGPEAPLEAGVVVVGTRATAAPMTVTRPMLFEWLTSGQVRYRFGAVSGVAGESAAPFNGMSFVRIYDVDGNNPVTYYGNGATTDVWIDSDAGKLVPVEVGAFYRTDSAVSYTLSNFPVPPGGDLAPIGTSIAKLADSFVPESSSSTTTRLARVYRLNGGAVGTRSPPTPTEVRWVFMPTVFRAEVPVGAAFDPTKTVPPLDDGVHDRVLSDAGPMVATFEAVGDLLNGNKSPGMPLRWDQVDLKLYPVHPATHRLTWKDKNDSSIEYKIEIVSGYPGQTVNLTTARENADGTRMGAAPDYVTQTTLETVAEISPGVAFPAQDQGAHYRHLFDPTGERRPPTLLDADATDEWFFHEIPYTDNGTSGAVAVGTSGAPFNVQGVGRSVALFSYRPNSDEIADGSLSKERLAVRVIRSAQVTPILADSPQLVLGRRGLALGAGSAANRGGLGVVRASGSTTVDPGVGFVMDFWLNAKTARDAPLVLRDCATNGTVTVVCASTAKLVAGMKIAGATIPSGAKIASVVDATTFELDTQASDSGTGLTLTASGKPVTILTTKDGRLTLTHKPAEAVLELSYFGEVLRRSYPAAGASWRHHVIHVFANQVSNGPQATVVNHFVDGVREETGFVTTTRKALADTAGFDVTAAISANSLRFGVDADLESGMQLDQFRLFANVPVATVPASPSEPWLSAADVQRLRSVRSIGTGIRGVAPVLWFSFDRFPGGGTSPSPQDPLLNNGSLSGLRIGPAAVDSTFVYAGILAHTDLQEVATRLECTLDNAGFGGSGYVMNAVSNYNPQLYNRAAAVGLWGPIFPVNHDQLFLDANRRLEVAYYENPHLSENLNHPNVAWPYQSVYFNEVKYPSFGPHKNKAIYIASRVGSEGVDQTGRVQEVFRRDKYSSLSLYHQTERTEPGFNPNEEHALVAPSGRAALRVRNEGEDLANNAPPAAFALQKDVNDSVSGAPYTSDPWVLVQVNNLATGEPEMAAYQVFKTRAGTVPFPRPADSLVDSTEGIEYASAETPEERFLVLDPGKVLNFNYQFEYSAFAGELLVPPYPLNLVIGNVAMADARGNNIQVNGVNQRALWRDVNRNAWVVSGNGRFFHQFFYPMRADFYLPGSVNAGTPVAWVPDDGKSYTGTGTTLEPVKVVYDTFWRSNYPKLKRGETLTYQGGEYFNENPGSNGLPALVAMRAAELVYDSATPSMIYGPAAVGRFPIANASVRITRPLDRRERPFTVANMGASGFTPAAGEKIFVVAERWYFKQLPGSLQKRFYFDSLAQKLVFRGYLNDKDSGDKDLTSGPDPLNVLEPNVLTKDDYDRLRALSATTAWRTVVDEMYLLSQNPHGAVGANTSATQAIQNLQGFKSPSGALRDEVVTFFSRLANQFGLVFSPAPSYVPLDSFGVGSAMVPNANLLTNPPTGSLYVTIAENNRAELAGAPVSLHIIEIIPDRYRGAIKVIEAADAFSERVSLQHNGEFGGDTGDLYYEWWIRDAGALDEVAQEVIANGTLKEFDASGNTLWQEYLPKERLENNNLTLAQKHLGLNSIVFEGRPDVVLADKLVLMRYRHKNESEWKLVPFEVANPVAAWAPGTPAPFQWAGAANSPQMQADGSKRYIPQLIMGWVKRVMDRINPYEARYTDFFGNESPATYSSQIQIAGPPFAGNVALNPDKNVIENTGLIELYMTVLNRARSLSIDNSTSGPVTDGINQALLLAATRLSVLYELLAREAYTDAQDATINAGEDGALLGITSFTHAFQNMEASLLHEELALLRGTDFLKSFPVYNRMFWNYAKGLGEAAYNVNYNINDANTDGFINEDDARKLFPQGHGDAWGHFLSAIDMHYTLLSHPGFNWRTRSELYSLMQNVLEVDYLDEKTFIRLAAARARTGRDVVRNTYRLHYTQDPAGQWQGYTDSGDPARAWGVSEWAHRAGQAAWFDFAVSNALLPEKAPGANPENLDLIERSAAIDEMGEIAGAVHEIQVALDEANAGVNPLGFDSDALSMDIDPFYTGTSWELQTHFEQIYDRALDAAGNAMAALEFATKSGNKLRALGDDADALIVQALSQDLDYRNRLIEIFGRPYDGTIGFGKAYPEGYEGPDVLLFSYLDKVTIDKIVPPKTATAGAGATVTFDTSNSTAIALMNNQVLKDLYASVWGSSSTTQLTKAFETLVGNNNYLFELDPDGAGPLTGPPFTASYNTASKYGFEVTPEMNWGQRTSYGRLQRALHDMLAAEIAIDTAVADYVGFLMDFEQKLYRIQSQLALFEAKNKNHKKVHDARAGINAEIIVLNTIFNFVASASEAALYAANGIKDGLPIVNGFSNDFTSIGRGIASVAHSVAMFIRDNAETLKELNESIMKTVLEAIEFAVELNNDQIDQINTLEGMLEEFEQMTGSEQPKRNAIGEALHQLEAARHEYVTAQAEGFRLMREREAFNKILASKVQKNRYQDMIMRISRNEAMTKYQSAFNNAARYAWLAARAYDYETSLDQGHPAAAGTMMDRIVKERQLGLWVDGEPRIGNGGLAEILAQLSDNFKVLKGQLGISNPQRATETISMRQELFRIMDHDPEVYDAFDTPAHLRSEEQAALVEENPGAPESRERWQELIKARVVPDLNRVPEFVRHCRPFAAGTQPGIVIRFATSIEPGRNVFGLPLAPGDHNYSTANYATKIQAMGVWLERYAEAGLANTPRGYLVPIGNDYLRTSTTSFPVVRMWSVVEQRIPIPFTINQSNLSTPGFIPTLNGINGVFGELRRHGDFRMYHDEGDPDYDDSVTLNGGSRLVGRSVWNSQWMLVIPGAGLYFDPEAGLERFAESVSDIKLHIETYSHQGQ